MAPLEVFFGVLVFIFTLIGLVRGFLKELGVTMVMMFMLFFLSQFEPFLNTGINRVLALGTRYVATQSHNLLKCWFFIGVIIATAFVSYEGETLAFSGQLAPGPQRMILGALTGTLNGYLIVGTIWFYMDKFGYPITWLGFSADKLSSLAKGILPFLPIPFLGQPILLGQSLLLYLSILLLLARVIR